MGSCMNVSKKNAIRSDKSRKSSDDSFEEICQSINFNDKVKMNRFEYSHIISTLQDLKVSNLLRLELDKSSLYMRRRSSSISSAILA
ncbi:hypothetical protein SteCoe_37095 [Stentor coeruleus]|uniref:Uncharacterized protein n=1 Tax=Stentor coeruleus TaxID=5963 RepID=A0A1R2ANQ1_9CILI|nr:hypothetical protein SteCoe_37095 [Stentor coeruleus]